LFLPFDASLFQPLDPLLRDLYLAGVLPHLLLGGEGNDYSERRDYR